MGRVTDLYQRPLADHEQKLCMVLRSVSFALHVSAVFSVTRLYQNLVLLITDRTALFYSLRCDQALLNFCLILASIIWLDELENVVGFFLAKNCKQIFLQSTPLQLMRFCSKLLRFR